MADKEKKVAKNSEVDKATTDESKAAAKVAKAAKGSKDKKPGFFNRASKGTKRFFKDFKGETKKIVWPDAKTVLKSTGIVLLVVAILTIFVGVIDFGLERGIYGLKLLAKGDEATTSAVTPGNAPTTVAHDHDGDGVADHDDDAHKDEATSTTGATSAVAHDHDGDGVADHDDDAHE